MILTICAGIILAAFGAMVFTKVWNEIAKDYARIKTGDYSSLIATGVALLFAFGVFWSIDYMASATRRPGEKILKCTAYRPDTATAAGCELP